MLQLSFNQKVGVGFATIILLLLISGLSSLWNLWGINESTKVVSDDAVPVVKESNQVQIQLLKLAKLSSLAYNAPTTEEIMVVRERFGAGTELFAKLQAGLNKLVSHNSEMSNDFNQLTANFNSYKQSVDDMFTAKLETLAARQRMLDEAGELSNLVDAIGGSLTDITYYKAPPGKEADMELVTGFANGADGRMLGVIKTINEIKIATELDQLASSDEDLTFVYNDSRNLLASGERVFKDFDENGLLETAFAAYDDLYARLTAEPNLVAHKKEQLAQALIALDKLKAADTAVSAAITNLDKMLETADNQFGTKQGEVFSSLDFGFKSSIAMLVVLILLATQNFNSMRQAIRKKMEDLAKLNSIGGTLAAAQSQGSALEEVLQCMNEKIGVSQGSVFLADEGQKLKLKACFPPKNVEEGVKPAKFALGQGIIGRVAETKKVVFVPNTGKEKNFIQKEGEPPKALLCVPLVDKDLLVGVINLSGDVKSVNFADSDYEFVSSVARSLVTTIKNIRMREVIEEHNRSLEQKVEERTAALRQKNRDIASMMANMHQGLFTIIPGGLIHSEYASYLENIFETKRIADRNFSDLLFSHANLSADAIDQCITAVASIVGEDAMMFDFNSHCLPTEMVIHIDDSHEKILELDWDAIISDDLVEKLMVTVRDVTALRALEAEAKGQKQELEIIGEILAVDAKKFKEFVNTSESFVDECRKIIDQTPEKDVNAIAQLFRNMHTVKGNARTYGLKYIAEAVHGVESTYDDLRKNEDVQWHPPKLVEELETANNILRKYGVIFSEKLGRDAVADVGGTALDPAQVSGLLQRIHELPIDTLPGNVKSLVSDTYNLLISAEAKPMDQVIGDVIQSANSLADQLGKKQPLIKIDNGDLFIKREAHNMLNNIFMHVFRNAIDHGIEKPEDRAAKGKPEQGTIELLTQEGDGFATFSVRDDGRGVAIGKIFEKAIEKGIYPAGSPRPPAEEIANLIFASGFSTAEQVTDVSGRGVGMDAVKNFLETNGGGISVMLDQGDEAADFRTFVTQIRIPEKFYHRAPEFAETA